MWRTGILAARGRLRKELVLEDSSQVESSFAGGVNVAVGEDEEFDHLFYVESICARSPAVIVAPILGPVFLVGAVAPLPFTGTRNAPQPQIRDPHRPLL